MNAGVELRLAREKRGLSREELSARTKISLPMLEAIEECQFDRMPAVIYLRGFLRSYAAEVGLAPAVVVDRYLAYCESATQALTAFDSEATLLETVVSTRPPAPAAGDDFESETALPFPDAAAIPSVIPRRSVAPIAAIGAGVVIMAASLVGVRSFGSAPAPGTLAAMLVSQPAPHPAATLAVKAIAPQVPLRASATPTSTASLPMPAIALTAAPAAPLAAPPLLSGAWTLTNEVQSTSFKMFEGLQLGYRLRLEQDGAIVTGTGEKWSENGREIPSSRRTPISIAGTLHEGQLELSFTEIGTRRSSAGRFVWRVSDDGELRGTFSSDAAASRGSSYARRLP